MLMFSRVQAQTKLVLEKGKVQKWASMSRMWCWEHFVGIIFLFKTLLQCMGKMMIFMSNITRLQFQPGHFWALKGIPGNL